jgi:MoaA/NifB/PqqE/SkfB family radical SAM enzyme
MSKITNKKTVIGDLVEKVRRFNIRLKASKPFWHENSNALDDHRHFAEISADSVHLKKPPGGPKGLIGPPCHGTLAAGGKKIKFYTGWKLGIFKLRFVISLVKYLVRRRKYPLFSIKSLHLYRKKKLLELPKIPKFGKHYYNAILRIPRWPSTAYDRMVAGGGLNLSIPGTPMKQHIDSVILAVTGKCKYSCQNCYEYNRLAENDRIPIERWREVIKELQKLGVSVIVLSGGEPMLRFEGLIEILAAVDTTHSDFHVHTSGYGVTQERAIALKKCGVRAAAVALDDYNPGRHDRLKGYAGAHKKAIRAIKYFHEAGIFPYINLCLRKDLIGSGSLWKYFDYVKDLDPGVGVISLLEPKPCGRYIPGNGNGEDLLSEDDRNIVIDFFKKANRDKMYKDYPYVAYMQYFEKPERFGCLMGGLSHFYINSSGHVQPCVFLPVSFGSIMEEDFIDIFKKMRGAVPAPLHQPCPALTFFINILKKHAKKTSFGDDAQKERHLTDRELVGGATPLWEKIKHKKNQNAEIQLHFEEIRHQWQQMFK